MCVLEIDREEDQREGEIWLRERVKKPERQG
jgi:hypothetical protein